MRAAVGVAVLGLGALVHSAYGQVAQAPVITLSYGNEQTFGTPGHPQHWVNLLGNVTSPADLLEFEYSLNGGPFYSVRPKYGTANDLAIGPDGHRLARLGDFNLELDRHDLVAGPNTVLIRATDSSLTTTQQAVTVHYTPDTFWPEDYVIDWSAVSAVTDAVRVIDGQWSLTPAGLRVDLMDYDRVVTFGDLHWDDYELLVPITLHALDPNGFNPISVSPGFGATFRWQGHFSGPADPDAYPNYYWWPAGAGFWYDVGNGGPLSLGTWAGNLGLVDNTGFAVAYDTTYMFRMRVETQGAVGSRYRLKAWALGDPEPADWLLDGTETFIDQKYGSIIVVAHHVDITVGNVIVTRLPDPNPPVISSIAVRAGPTSATITWRTNEPASSAVSYGLTAAYESGTVSDPTPKLVHSISLDGLSTGQVYHFRISSVDIDGNAANSGDLQFLADNDQTPPQFSSIAANPSTDSAQITWNTNEPATSRVDYWLPDASTNSIQESAYTTSHVIELPNLLAGQQYFYRVAGQDLSGNFGTSAVQSFTTLATVFTSDDFSSCLLEGPWSFLDPAGAGLFDLTGHHARITVAATGQAHDVWINGILAPRVRQPCADEDFILEVKFDSPITQSFQSQGVLIEEEAGEVRVLRAEFHHYDTLKRIYVTTITGPQVVDRLVQTVTLEAPMALRITRTGDVWNVWYRLGAGPWQNGVTFVKPMAVSHVSFFGGNGPANGHEVLCDYFFESASPVFPEDDCDGNGQSDSVDIAQGVLADLDGDGIPDICTCTYDCDSDGVPDVEESPSIFDGSDYPSFAECLSGPGASPPVTSSTSCACARYDRDGDGDVDLADYRRFQAGFSP